MDDASGPDELLTSRDAFFGWRRTQGVVWSHGEHAGGFAFLRTRERAHCGHCHRQTSFTAATIFAYAKLPLTPRVIAIDLLTQQKTLSPRLSSSAISESRTPPLRASSTSSSGSCSSVTPIGDSPG
jgi:hypothetical protein